MQHFMFGLIIIIWAWTVRCNAQTTIWTGVSGTNWHNPTNWTMGVPDFTKEAIIPVGGVAQIGMAAMARNLRNEGELTVFPTGSLNIENAPIDGLVNLGDIFNEGSIEIKGIGSHGILNYNSGNIYQMNGATISVGDPV